MEETGMTVFLETERMVLRRFTENDDGLLFGLDADPEVMRYLTGGRPTPREEVRERILPAMLGWYERCTDRGFWAAQTREGGFLGWFHLREPTGADPGEPELGYRLRRSAWGRGYATEGSRALVSAAFSDPSVRRVFARTMAVNAGSRRVMEKAGMRLVRTFNEGGHPIPGSEHGDVEYAITRAEWEKAYQPALGR
ncbi:GNAT family N-acetyltransferase [Nocardiopsis composta]|uniref:RimJ/RimL family protein N-acetyltransferase n=1 Tax=Nocardiopsis composta TaxID=157465 RepID=A0A7W8QJ62_9ACTN|nr:GNAT family N-acetyltransferase [Nocardiopsis composta]MBB5430743.1 RimJ/RimL family protein N-acetyltransferase [Nocardiopsis composta]